VLIFEHVGLYNTKDELAEDAPATDLDHAVIRRNGEHLTLITYGGSLPKCLAAAQLVAQDGIEVEVIDLRTLRPLDDALLMASVARTRRVLIVDEGWRSGSLSAEISARIMEQAFYELDAPVARLCSAEVPVPYAAHLEQAALPQVDAIAARVRRVVKGDG
jgi:pyruvate dehydrogenase E1 component beta subunit